MYAWLTQLRVLLVMLLAGVGSTGWCPAGVQVGVAVMKARAGMGVSC